MYLLGIYIIASGIMVNANIRKDNFKTARKTKYKRTNNPKENRSVDTKG